MERIRIKVEGERLKYLDKKIWEKENYGLEIRPLIKLRCGNMEEDKYWMENRGEKMCFL